MSTNFYYIRNMLSVMVIFIILISCGNKNFNEITNPTEPKIRGEETSNNTNTDTVLNEFPPSFFINSPKADSMNPYTMSDIILDIDMGDLESGIDINAIILNYKAPNPTNIVNTSFGENEKNLKDSLTIQSFGYQSLKGTLTLPKTNSKYEDGIHLLYIYAQDIADTNGTIYSNYFSWKFYVDSTPPTITSIKPNTNDGTNLTYSTKGGFLDLTYTAGDNLGPKLKEYTYSAYIITNGIMVKTLKENIIKIYGINQVFWYFKDNSSNPVSLGEYEFKIIVTDTAGNSKLTIIPFNIN